MIEQWMTAPRSGATIVTATQRLARYLTHAYGQARKRQNTGEIPDILPYSAWLKRCWNEACRKTGNIQPRHLLNAAQEHALWETVIQRSSHQDERLQVAATAQSAAEAWRLLHAWRLPTESTDIPLAQDTEIFFDWAADYRNRRDRLHGLDSACLPKALAEAVRQGNVKPPKQLIHAGFDELPPQDKHLFQTLESNGCAVRALPTNLQQNHPTQIARIGLATADHEIAAAARWAKRRLQRNPQAQIGIVVPRLPEQRSAIIRRFDDVLCPIRRIMIPLNFQVIM